MLICQCPRSRVHALDGGARADLAAMLADVARQLVNQRPRPTQRVVIVQIELDVGEGEEGGVSVKKC